MAVVVLCSAKGAPGVTTTALGLALAWPRDVLLVDADRMPSHAIEAGWLGGVPAKGRGLLAVAQAHRERQPLRQAIWELSIPLDRAEQPVRRFLSGFSHPGAAGLFEPMWAELASNLADLDDVGVDVVVDAGRVGAGLPPALMQHADCLAIVTRSSLRDLAALRLTLPAVVEAAETEAPRAEVGLIVAGPDQPYSEAEIAHHFGLAALGSLPWAPQQASVWSDGDQPAKRHESSPLAKAYVALAARLAQRLGRRSRMLAEVAG